MRRSTILTSVAAVALLASNAFAQGASFAGTWTMVPDPNAAAAGGGGGGGGGGGRGGRGGGGGACGGATFTIAQDAKTMTCSRMQAETEVKAVYMLDGSESKNMVAGRGGQTEQVSKAMKMGNSIMISRSQDMGGTMIEIKQTFSMDASGNLVIETSRPGQDGAPVTTKVQYKK